MPLEFNYSFGFRTSKNSVAFYDERTALFAAGKMCILFNLDSKDQRCFQLAERAEVTAIVRCGILIATAIRGHPPSVCLFNTLSETKKFYLGPASMKSGDFLSLSVSSNFKFVAAQGGFPDWCLVIWLSQTREVVINLSPAGSSGTVRDISFNSASSVELVVVGSNVFKLFEYQEEDEEKAPFVEHVFEKFEKSGSYYAIGWPQKENLCVGTSEGKILFFRGIELIHEVSVTEDVVKLQKFDCLDLDVPAKVVTSLCVTSHHLLCIFAESVVLVYEGEEFSDYKLLKFVDLPSESFTHTIPGELKVNQDKLIDIIVSPTGNDLIAATSDGQLLWCTGFVKGTEPQRFTSLLQRQHNEPVIGIDVAQSRSLIASCSLHVAVLWNYSNRKQELRKVFRDEITSIAVHPTGLYMALGFYGFCRTFSILYSGLRDRQTIYSRNCFHVGFAHGGHLLGIVSGSVIEIHSFITSTLLFKLDGHADYVTCFEWKDNDSKLVSCDKRGVVCEWDLMTPGKIWENTAVLSYLSVCIDSLTRHIIVIDTSKNVRCLKDALIQWEFKTKKDLSCIVFYSNSNEFYIGTSDGYIVSYNFPLSNENSSIHAHSGKVSAIKLNFPQSFLISAGSDNFILLWSTAAENNDLGKGLFSDVSLVDVSYLQEQRDKSKQLRLSLQHTSSTSDVSFELNCVKQEEVLRKMALTHEETIDNLNEKIVNIKEEIQNILYDSDPKVDLKELVLVVRKEIINTTSKLDEAYKQSDAYSAETEIIVSEYENIIDLLNKEHAKFSCAERNTIDEITKQIKVIEENVVLEKEIIKEVVIQFEEQKCKVQNEMFDEAGKLKPSQRVQLENENFKSTHLKQEVEKFVQLTSFKRDDTKNRRNINAGQVDYDIKEKMQSVSLLKEDFRELESVLEAREKIVQNQEKKFCEMRKTVGGLQKSLSVSKTAIDELTEDINSKQSKIESCQGKIKRITDSIPTLEEEIQLVQELCSTVTEKLGETVDGFHKKQKALRSIQGGISKYTSMLHQCIAKNCDVTKLVYDISQLFENSRIDFIDEATDLCLIEEFDFQIEKLKKSYDLIKNEPTKAMRDKSMAEFRLSQENSKILHEVHDIQKDIEKFRVVIYEMESALGTQTAQAKTDDLRGKIDFVISESKRNRKDRMDQIEKLDTFIVEQQKEIERFQTILSSKLKQKK